MSKEGSGGGGKVAAAYVDGFNLYFGLRDAGLRRFYWLDVHKLCQSFCRPGTALAKTCYFTAYITGNGDKAQRQRTFIEAVTSHSPAELILGRYIAKPRRCHSCRVPWVQQEEKKTDAAIASRLVADAFLDRYDVAFIVTGDSDIVPAIEQVKEHKPEKRIIVALPPRRHSQELKQVAHAHFAISETALRTCQLPETVTKADGFHLRRPASWT